MPSYATYVKERLSGFDGRARRCACPVRATSRTSPSTPPRHRTSAAIPQPAAPVRSPYATRRRSAATSTAEPALRGARPTEVFMTAASPGVIAALPAQRVLPERRGLPLRARRRDEGRVRARSSRPASCCSSTAPTSRWRATTGSPTCRVADFRQSRGACTSRCSTTRCGLAAGAHADAPLLGQLRGPAPPRRAAGGDRRPAAPARPPASLFEAANPRHAHEWQVWRDVELPDGKILIPGVIDTTTNFVEHPELVAQRIVQLRRGRRPRERDRRHRLRLRDVRMGAEGGRADRVGKARGDGRGRPHRFGRALGLISTRASGARVAAGSARRPPLELEDGGNQALGPRRAEDRRDQLARDVFHLRLRQRRGRGARHRVGAVG